MGQTEASRQADFITAPIAGQLGAYTTGAATSQDLQLLGPQVGHNDTLPLDGGIGLVGHYAYFHAETNDVYVIFGATAAAVTAGNAPIATAGATNAAGNSFRIPVGQTASFKIQPATRFVGYMGSAAGILRIGLASV